MKKLMLVVAVLATVAVQAATVSWTCTNVKKGDAAVDGTAYVFFSTSADTSWVAALSGQGVDAVKAAMTGANMSYTPSEAGKYTYNASSMGANVDQSSIGLAGNTTYNLYLVVFDTKEITDASNFMVTTVKSGATYGDASSSNKAFALGSQATASQTWNAVGVPEPTSGLMLLLGVAGLALRRRRA